MIGIGIPNLQSAISNPNPSIPPLPGDPARSARFRPALVNNFSQRALTSVVQATTMTENSCASSPE